MKVNWKVRFKFVKSLRFEFVILIVLVLCSVSLKESSLRGSGDQTDS